MSVKLKALRPGSTLAVLSPASTPRPELVEAGVRELESWGYRVRLMPSALARGPLYYAGAVAARVADLHAAFADDAIDGLVCTRGGWGSAELLPHLDAELIRAHPKPFVGYSDHTSLHTWFQNVTGMVTFHGPMVAADFSRPDGADRTSWLAALADPGPWTLDAATGLRVLQPGRATGTLRGGCLALIAESLGTPYAFKPEPEPKNTILFLEDIGVKPYQWDRMLVHLRLAGVLNGVRGIVLGDMTQSCAESEQPLLEQAILHALRDFEGPVAIGLRSGHVAAGNVTLPLGVQVELECRDRVNPAMHFPESAVSA